MAEDHGAKISSYSLLVILDVSFMFKNVRQRGVVGISAWACVRTSRWLR